MDIQNYAKLLLLSILISAVLGKIIIPVLKKQKVGQNIRDDGPESHLKKQGTPTMGGIIIALTVLIGFLILFLSGFISSVSDSKLRLKIGFVLLSAFGFGGIGFVDDFMMLVMKRSMGLDEKQKIVMQFALSIILVYMLKQIYPETFSIFKIPFINKSVNLGISSYLIYFLLFLGTVNAVNLTDGLDGLLSSVTIPVLLLMVLISRQDLLVISFAIVLLGAILGFLFYNSNKASVFMGDTGSMFIGGAIAAMALLTETSLYLPIYGVIYVIEAGSVIIQVISYKTRNKKRVFLMSPIHHHYELKGFNEQKIVTAFANVSLMASLIALIFLRGRL